MGHRPRVGRDPEHRGAATQETVRLTVAEMRELVQEIDRMVEVAQQRSDAAGSGDRHLWDMALLVGRDDLA